MNSFYKNMELYINHKFIGKIKKFIDKPESKVIDFHELIFIQGIGLTEKYPRRVLKRIKFDLKKSYTFILKDQIIHCGDFEIVKELINCKIKVYINLLNCWGMVDENPSLFYDKKKPEYIG